eukprot:jgi/Mesen1/7155/ME000037S06509
MSGDTSFAPQTQESQPGRQHELDPAPRSVKHQYKPSDKLAGRVAVITGGDSGIGRAVALMYALEGASVAFTYVPGEEEKDAQDTLEGLKEKKHASAKEPLAIPMDLQEDKNCKQVIDQVMDHFGQLDILVNNCAIQHYHEALEEISTDEWLQTYALPHMKEGASIINSTSINAYKGNAGLIPYSTTKGAILAFTRSLALNLATKNIRVNGVAPGPVWTPLIAASVPDPEKVAKFGEATTPMKRAGQPDEIATAYVFLASNDASFFTGQVLHPNGGAVVNA